LKTEEELTHPNELDSDDETPTNQTKVEVASVEKPYYSSVIFRADAGKPVIEWSTNLETDK